MCAHSLRNIQLLSLDMNFESFSEYVSLMFVHKICGSCCQKPLKEQNSIMNCICYISIELDLHWYWYMYLLHIYRPWSALILIQTFVWQIRQHSNHVILYMSSCITFLVLWSQSIKELEWKERQCLCSHNDILYTYIITLQ